MGQMVCERVCVCVFITNHTELKELKQHMLAWMILDFLSK